MQDKREVTSEMRCFGDEEIEVIFRKVRPIDDTRVRYPGFKQETKVLLRGYVHKKGARPLPCDIIFERDVAVTLRDGVIIYTDIFRPASGTNFPAIVAWSPYGKEEGISLLDDFPFRAGVPKNAVSELQKFEAPDPAYWCNHGYAVINPDARGAFSSQGDICHWGTQEARDGYDLIEWAASQSWSNGKVGLSGNSWLAVIQWFVAAERPPHLAAIAPWEGASDPYRDSGVRGGIPDDGFADLIAGDFTGKNRMEDYPAMIRKFPFMNGYWKDKIPKFENISIPAYVVASWTSPLHTRGTLDAFTKIVSKDKWLRVHNTLEWPDYYDPKYTEDLRRFFDHYLKGIQNGWEKTPRVRLSILNPGGIDTVDRPENEYPLARTVYKKLYLNGAAGTLAYDVPAVESTMLYKGDDGKGKADFTITFDKDTELTGPMKLHLWVEADGADDIDLFVLVQKLSKKGRFLTSQIMTPANPVFGAIVRFLWALRIQKLSGLFFFGATGRLRVSHRELDEARSTPAEPVLLHRREQRLKPGEIVPVDISIWPMGMRWRGGEKLRVAVTGYNPIVLPMPGIQPIVTRNKGDHIIYTGGKYDSYLQIPVIPPAYRS